jgi:putative FmdB family regulatory protein
MPTYEYECRKCGKVFEMMQAMTDPPRKRCLDKNCRGKVVRLISAGSGLIFKGSGFYITDYKKGADGSKAGEKTESTSTDPAKSETAAKSETTAKTETKSEAKTVSSEKKSD